MPRDSLAEGGKLEFWASREQPWGITRQLKPKSGIAAGMFADGEQIHAMGDGGWRSVEHQCWVQGKYPWIG